MSVWNNEKRNLILSYFLGLSQYTSLHSRLLRKSLGVCSFQHRSKLLSVQQLCSEAQCCYSQQVAEFMYSRQSVLCPGWLSPNCNPATCRIFDPLNTCVPKIYLDDPLRKACTLKTVNVVFKMVTTSEIKSLIQQAKYILKVLSSCIYKSLCSVCAHMTHNRYPTLSETLTGLAL